MGTKVEISFKNIFNELVLPEWLNGKEESYVYLNKDKGKTGHLMETCRRFQSLYDVICSARFNLACSCRLQYPELLDSGNPMLSHVWMRSQFLNNSILWYNAAFDLTLQPLWMYYKLYEKNKPHLILTSENLERILESCRFESLIRNGKTDLGNNLVLKLDHLNSNMHDNIREWANTLKHRQKIEYDELSKNNHLIVVGGSFAMEDDEEGRTIINFYEGEYNSSKTIKRINIIEVTKTLISFHKELVAITKEIDEQIELS